MSAISREYSPKIYTNSERAVNWIRANLPDSVLAQKLGFFKNKFAFRQLVKDSYPDFRCVEIDVQNIKPPLEFPFIVKPVEGFLSEGVTLEANEKNWNDLVSRIGKGITDYIAEELIEGEEFAVDAFFDSRGKPTILDIFRHPFPNAENTVDRLYYTSKKVIAEEMSIAINLLEDILKYIELKNFPLHLEYRKRDSTAIPIEVNPMRFAGWCTTEMVNCAYKINPYEYFFEDKSPDWARILKEKKANEIYYFAIAENPSRLITSVFKQKEFLVNFENPIETNFAQNGKVLPIFGVVFGKSERQEEIEKILGIDISAYIEKDSPF